MHLRFDTTFHHGRAVATAPEQSAAARQLPRARGYALMLTMAFISVSLLILASLAKWNYTSSAMTARNNAYNSAVAAAEGATELVIAQMSHDFFHQALSTDVRGYTHLVPSAVAPTDWPAGYDFSDGLGNPNLTDVVCTGWQSQTNLSGLYSGLYGMINSYQIVSNAKGRTGLYPVSAGVQQNIAMTSIPIFQYAVYYALDLEINPGAPMIVTGKTHGNADLYLAPSSSLEFKDTVSYVGQINYNRSTNDPTGGPKTTPVFDSTVERVSALNLPTGTDNNPTNVAQIIQPPPSGEVPTSDMGRERFYNKSDLVINITSSGVGIQFNNFEDGSTFTAVPTNSSIAGTNSGYSFVNTNLSFYDYREGKQVQGTEVDVQALTNWMGSSGFSYNVQAQAQMGHPINSVYVNDQRTGGNKLTAVRIVNGQYLPSSGLTLATSSPLYVKGNLNAPDLTPGSTNTANLQPASLVSDAITILSANWNDAWNASTPLSARSAVDTTVNAAFLSGIVPSTTVNGQAHYSGGVENFPRFLEDWGGDTLTYNGSMVVMFASQIATSFWVAPGTYYNPPTRKWAFNVDFLNPGKLPPNTPQLKTLQRDSWSVVAAAN